MSEPTPAPAPSPTPASRRAARLFRLRSVVALSLASAIVGASGGAGAVFLTSDEGPAVPDETQRDDAPPDQELGQGTGGDVPEERWFPRMRPGGPGGIPPGGSDGLPPGLQPEGLPGDGGAGSGGGTPVSEA